MALKPWLIIKMNDKTIYDLKAKNQGQEKDTAQIAIVQIKDNDPGVSEDVRKRVLWTFLQPNHQILEQGMDCPLFF